MMKNKIFAVLLSSIQICMIIPMPVIAETTEVSDNIAYIEFSDENIKHNISSASMGGNEAPMSSERDGMMCWVMDEAEDAYIDIVFDSEFADTTGTATYDIEVDYYDESKRYFTYWYESEDGKKYGDEIYLENEGLWKTAKFTLDDAAFYNQSEGDYDFRLALQAPVTMSSVEFEPTVAIKRLKVTRNDNKNPIYVDSTIDESGAAFEWYSNEKIIHDHFENRTDKDLTVQVRRVAVGEETQEVLFDETEKLSFGAYEEKTVDFDFSEYDKCEQYEYKIFISSEAENISSEFTPIRFAVIKTDPDGIKNENVYMNTFVTQRDNYTDLIEVADKSNIGGVRMPVFWWMIEPSTVEKGVYIFDGQLKDSVEKLTEKNIKILPTLSMQSFHYTRSINTFPSTEEQLEGWRNYVRFTAEKFNEYGVEQFEIWNEPDLGDNNSVLLDDGVTYMTGAAYVPVYNIALEEIKNINRNALVIGPGVCTGSSGTQFVDEALKAGWGETVEAFSWHPYHNYREEIKDSVLSLYEQYKDEFAKYQGHEDINIWITESGVTPSDFEVTNDENKGNWNTRKLYYLPAAGVDGVITLFNLDGRGLVRCDRQDMYGHLAEANADLYQNTNPHMPFAPMLKIAAECYVMADSTPTGNIYRAGEESLLCEYKSNKFNADILAMNTISTNETVTLNLGCDKVDYYDEFGNMTTIYGENGLYTFTLDESPSYIVGNFNGVRVAESNILEYNKVVLDTISGSTAQFTITNNTDEAYSIEASGGYGLEIAENKGFTDNKATVKVDVLADEGTYSYVTVKIKDGDKVIQQSRIKVSVIKDNSVSSAPVRFGKYSLSYFNTFDEYVKTDDSDVWPEGFAQWPQGLNPCATGFRGIVEEEADSRALYFEDTDSSMYPMFAFDTLVQEGTAHISFDLKVKDYARFKLMGSTTKNGSRNPYSYFGMWNGEAVDTVYNLYFSMNGNEAAKGKLSLQGVEKGQDISMFYGVYAADADAEWHKYDLVFDLDKNTYTPYIDGKKIVKSKTITSDGDPVYTYYENLSQIYDLKNIHFYIPDGNVWIDNLAAFNYETLDDGTLKAPVMRAEEINGVDLSKGKVNVSFSEHITAAAPVFSVVNVENGKEFTPASVTKLANSSYQLGFSELDEGTYKVFVKGVTGTISKKEPVSQAVFSTLTEKYEKEIPLTLIDEDFKNYKGGIPTGWTELTDSTSTVTKVAGPDGKNAIHLAKKDTASTDIKKNASIYYLFDDNNKIHGDNFTIEFDVNNLEAGWDIGLIRDSDIAERGENTRSTKDRVNSGFTNYTQYIAHQKYENVLFGSCDSGKIQVQNARYQLRHLITGADNITTVGDLSVGDWHHIKAEVNPQSSTVTLTVDGKEYAPATFPNEMLVTVTHADYDTKTGKITNQKYYHQIQGIRLENSKCNEKGVSFANIKVYKDTSYNTYQDFEGKLSQNSDAGWYTINGRGSYTSAENAGADFSSYYQKYVNPHITSAEGKNGGTAVKFTNSGTQQPVISLLSKPIEKNKAFVVEFDAKTNAPEWTIFAVPEGCENGEQLSVGSNALGDKATSFDDKRSVTAYIIGGRTKSNLAIGGMYQYVLYDNPTKDNQTAPSGTFPVAVTSDEWYHYKYIVTPNPFDNENSNGIQISVEMTAPDGTVTKNSLVKYVYLAANRLREYDTTGIGVFIKGSDTSHYVTMDNLKVFALDTATDITGEEVIVTEAYMESARATGLDGSVTYLSEDTAISANTKKIDIEFSTQISKTLGDKITLKMSDGTEIGAKIVKDNICTISFAGDALPEGEMLTLTVAPGISTTGGLTDDAHVYTISVDNDAELLLEDMVLYETISGGSKGDTWLGLTVPEATIPVKGTSVVGTPRFIINGYNGGERVNIFSGVAKYIKEEKGERLTEIESEIMVAEAATEFMIDVPLSDVISTEDDIIKVFTWNNETLKPLHGVWQYNWNLSK